MRIFNDQAKNFGITLELFGKEIPRIVGQISKDATVIIAGGSVVSKLDPDHISTDIDLFVENTIEVGKLREIFLKEKFTIDNKLDRQFAEINAEVKKARQRHSEREFRILPSRGFTDRLVAEFVALEASPVPPRMIGLEATITASDLAASINFDEYRVIRPNAENLWDDFGLTNYEIPPGAPPDESREIEESYNLDESTDYSVTFVTDGIYNFEKGSTKVQVIVVEDATPKAVLGNFDFTCCQVALFDEKLWWVNSAIEDILAKKLVISKDKIPSEARIAKYIQKGFRLA